MFGLLRSFYFRYVDPRKRVQGRRIHHHVILPAKEKFALGDFIFIGPNTFLDPKGKISIGSGSVISSNVTILSSSHSFKEGRLLPYDPIDYLHHTKIGRGVWVGISALIMPGVVLGDGVIVGAGAVVTKSVPDGCIVAGNPAKILDRRDVRERISKESFLLKAKVKKSQVILDER